MTLVVDASVVVKWLLSDPEREPATVQATNLMRSIVEGRESVVQPTHWLAEVTAVLARLSPATAEEDALSVALETPDATLVTADDRYLRAGRRYGSIRRLSQ